MTEFVSLSKKREYFLKRVHELQELFQVIEVEDRKEKDCKDENLQKKPQFEYPDLTASIKERYKPTRR